jgi:hypothetical protein
LTPPPDLKLTRNPNSNFEWLVWSSFTYWVYNYNDNRPGAAIVAFDETNHIVNRWDKPGVSCTGGIALDPDARTVTFAGENSSNLVLHWGELGLAPRITANALADFDFCLALTQAAINAQIAQAWEVWEQQKSVHGTVRIFKTVDDSGAVVDAPVGLQAALAALIVDFDVPSGKPGQVRVTLPLPSGTVTYFDERTGGVAQYAFQNWSVSFITDLDKHPIDLNILEQVDPNAHHSATELIRNSGLSDAAFAIEYLFLNFTDVDLKLPDNVSVKIPIEVPHAVRIKALDSLNFLLRGELGKFILGTVVRRSDAQVAPTFALTDFIFDIRANHDRPGLSTLAYLGMFARRPLPRDIPVALGRLTDAWVYPTPAATGTSVLGIMAISKDTFMNRYLIPRFSQRMNATLAVGDLTWTFSAASPENWTSSDIIDREWSRGKSWNIAIKIVPGTNTLNVAGRVASHANMDGYTKTANFGLFSLGHYHTEWIHIEGHQDLAGAITINAAGSGKDLALTASVNYAFEGVVVDNDTVAGGANVLTAFEGTFTGSTTTERLQSQQQDLVNSLRSWLDQALSNIQVDLNQATFIPPGGGGLILQKPHFSQAGDLLFDIVQHAAAQGATSTAAPPAQWHHTKLG